MKAEIFNNLFMLEIANNHWGSVERGIEIIKAFAEVVKNNNIKAAIKFQVRDVDNFIHPDSKHSNLRYVQKTLATKLSFEGFKILVGVARQEGFIVAATPFDEASVHTCADLGVEVFKIASSDIDDFPLIQEIVKYGQPTIVSTGGASDRAIDNIVAYFERKEIPLAVNHCVSLYPTQDSDLMLHQIDYLVNCYGKTNVIGFSSHERGDWWTSISVAYAKGARTFERHIDIDNDEKGVSTYCTIPIEADRWFRAFNLAVEMCGHAVNREFRRAIPGAEREYLQSLKRGLYARRNLDAGELVTDENSYLAIPCQIHAGQITSSEMHFAPFRTKYKVSVHGVLGFENTISVKGKFADA